MTTWAPHLGTSHWSRTEAPGGTKEPGSPRPRQCSHHGGGVVPEACPRPLPQLYIRHRAFSTRSVF